MTASCHCIRPAKTVVGARSVRKESISATEPDAQATSGTTRFQSLNSMPNSIQSDTHVWKRLRAHVRSTSLWSFCAPVPDLARASGSMQGPRVGLTSGIQQLQRCELYHSLLEIRGFSKDLFLGSSRPSRQATPSSTVRTLRHRLSIENGF
jgi:hypothetical protein